MQWYRTRFRSLEQNPRSSENSEFVDFQVSKPVFLAGIRLYGNQSCTYRIELKIQGRNVGEDATQNGTTLFETDGYVSYDTKIELIDDSYYGIEVLFDDHLPLEADKIYTIEANYDSNNSSFYKYGYESVKQVEVGDVTLKFMDNETQKCSPSSLSGQFPSLLLNFKRDD